MKNFVINLASQPARWSHIEKEFGKAGMKPSRFNALRAGDFPAGFFCWSFSQFLSQGWTAGEVACLSSHVAVWQSIVDQQLPHAVVFEDDVILGYNAKQVIDSLEFSLKPTVKKLETWFHPCFVSRRPVSEKGGTSFFNLLTQHRGAAGYALNLSAASSLIEMISCRPTRADILPFTPHLLRGIVKVEQLVPAIVIQQMFLDKAERDQRLNSSLSEERARKATQVRISLINRIISRFKRIIFEGKSLAEGRRIVVPFQTSSGQLMRRAAAD